jgi:hypothetical protein
MTIENVEQGTMEWHELRRGKITGTKMDAVMGTDLARLMLACELIAEEATEQTKTIRVSPEMERGSAEEVFARKHFEHETGKKVEELGFCVSDEFDYLGVSGDGWIKNGKDYTEAIEIKSPDSKNAVFYKLADTFPPEELGLGARPKPTKLDPEPGFKPGSKAPFCGIPAEYKWQVITYFLVNPKLTELHFVVYDARFLIDESKMHIVTVERSNPEIAAAIEEACQGVTSFRAFWLKLRSSIIQDEF